MGQIVGYGMGPGGFEEAFLLTPVTAMLGDFDLDGDVDGGDFLAWQRRGNRSG